MGKIKHEFSKEQYKTFLGHNKSAGIGFTFEKRGSRYVVNVDKADCNKFKQFIDTLSLADEGLRQDH